VVFLFFLPLKKLPESHKAQSLFGFVIRKLHAILSEGRSGVGLNVKCVAIIGKLPGFFHLDLYCFSIPVQRNG
jgi:hypothetical protein